MQTSQIVQRYCHSREKGFRIHRRQAAPDIQGLLEFCQSWAELSRSSVQVSYIVQCHSHLREKGFRLGLGVFAVLLQGFLIQRLHFAEDIVVTEKESILVQHLRCSRRRKCMLKPLLRLLEPAAAFRHRTDQGNAGLDQEFVSQLRQALILCRHCFQCRSTPRFVLRHIRIDLLGLEHRIRIPELALIKECLGLPQPFRIDRNAGEQLMQPEDIRLEVLQPLPQIIQLGRLFQAQVHPLRGNACQQLLAVLNIRNELLIIHRAVQVLMDYLVPADIVAAAAVPLNLLEHASSLDDLVTAHVVAAAAVCLLHRIRASLTLALIGIVLPFRPQPLANASQNKNTDATEDPLYVLHNQINHDRVSLFHVPASCGNASLPSASTYPALPPQ